MVEKLIEANIVSAISALGMEGVPVIGMWDVAAQGAVKGEEGTEHAAVVVRVPPMSYDTPGLCNVTISASITLTVRIDMCPTGEELAEYSARLAGLLEGWQLAETGADLVDFAVDGFEPGGFQATGGDGPTVEGQAWTVVQNFMLRGTVLHGEHR